MTKLKLLSVLGAILLPASAFAQANPSDFYITSTVFDSPLTIGGSYKFAGAISSLYWREREFVNVDDHGREIQTAASFNGQLECYNPTEAGSADDSNGPTSSSILGSVSTSSNILQTSNQMAFWLHDGETSSTCGGATAQGTLSGYFVNKTVSIGYAGIPNVIEYLSTLWVPEHVNSGQVEMVYAALNDITQVWRYDLTSKHYSRLWEVGGEQDAPLVLSMPADLGLSRPELYFAFCSPEALQQYDGSICFGWGVNTPATGGAGRIFDRFDGFGAGHRHYRSYLVVGTREEVQTGLNQLHYQFRNLDPDVFNWKDYMEMYPDVSAQFSGQLGAQTHWLNYGINEGRNGSRTFSPSTYLQLYPDLGTPTNYQFAIDHYMLWGRDEGRSTVKKAEAGFQHSTVLSTGLPKSAGLNNNGQLGDGNTNNSASPVSVTGLSNMTEVASGDFTSLGVRFDGTLWAWGSNANGLLGNGGAGASTTQPLQVANIPLLVTPTPRNRHVIAVGLTSCAAVDKEGYVWTWGNNGNGQLGDGTTVSHSIPMRVKKSTAAGDYLTDVVSVAVGTYHMLALDADGRVWAWGAGSTGALGNGSVADSTYPVRVAIEGNAVMDQIACGSGLGFSLALDRYGHLFGWGDNHYGQLGFGGGADGLVPTYVYAKQNAAMSGFTKIAAGGYHVVAISSYFPGAAVAWGYNGSGQLGSLGAAMIQRGPHFMDAGPDAMNEITDVAAGNHFSLMIRGSDRAVFGVGDNAAGQLGTGNTSQQNVPVRTGF